MATKLCLLPADQQNLRLLEATAKHSLAVMTEFDPQGIADMLWAYAGLDYQPPCKVLLAMCRHVHIKLAGFSSQNISTLICALAQFRHSDQVLPLVPHLCSAASLFPPAV